MAQIQCRECGREYSEQAEACPYCVAAMAPASSVKPRKSRPLAIVLALFLGGIGVHKFYLNKPKQGIVYLLFFWTYVPAIVGLVEVLLYLVADDERFQNEYVG